MGEDSVVVSFDGEGAPKKAQPTETATDSPDTPVQALSRTRSHRNITDQYRSMKKSNKKPPNVKEESGRKLKSSGSGIHTRGENNGAETTAEHGHDASDKGKNYYHYINTPERGVTDVRDSDELDAVEGPKTAREKDRKERERVKLKAAKKEKDKDKEKEENKDWVAKVMSPLRWRRKDKESGPAAGLSGRSKSSGSLMSSFSLHGRSMSSSVLTSPIATPSTTSSSSPHKGSPGSANPLQGSPGRTHSSTFMSLSVPSSNVLAFFNEKGGSPTAKGLSVSGGVRTRALRDNLQHRLLDGELSSDEEENTRGGEMDILEFLATLSDKRPATRAGRTPVGGSSSLKEVIKEVKSVCVP